MTYSTVEVDDHLSHRESECNVTSGGHFHQQLDELQASMVEMGELAGKLLGEAVASFVTKDTALARDVIARDSELDRLEDEHEEHTVQIIALHQPVARDLRLLIALLRVNASIEQVGDLAVNIAKSSLRVCDQPPIRPYVDIPRSYDIVRSIWDDSIRSFAEMNESVASRMRERDDVVDDMNHDTIIQLIEIGRDQPELIFQVTNLIGVSKALEHAADLSVDICDEVIFVCRNEYRHARRQRSTA